ncbi:TylF/MycF/NovP-related O-methyltransferase [Mycobacterium sp. RTGN5]|uniref:TylF/MycF/NovP-related O-methyltransferase n=1 Tax=Mycobacterium sp. RTGN5 TaxID=3016522 RepID=UPI0029C97157|nr:TylF/MycF/NovP-related O-methyltransferase [Mycobacterium sp. RTGN5]
MNIVELGKQIVYNSPVLNRIMAPKYPYKINPGQLCAMVNFIDATRSSASIVAEVGVAHGDTSVFLLEHMTKTADERTVYLFDTFSGFTERSIEHEVRNRNKDRGEYDKFRYGDERRFRQNLFGLGYSRFETVKGDASTVDWEALPPIGAMLLDVDLYQPTIEILEAVYPRLAPGGGIVLDDCLAGTPWDGSLQAYEEFISSHGLPFVRVGEKGTLIRAE